MTRAQALRAMRQALRDAGIESFSLDARLLLLHALGIDDMALLRDPDTEITAQQKVAADGLVVRRIAREPVARILGEQEFYGLRFSLGDDTLIPRPETEMLVDEALQIFSVDAPARILDLGTGTGCIRLSILHGLPRAHGLGIDRAEGALAVARRNAERLGLEGRAEFRVGDWAADVAGPFDLVVSNPPYIDHAVVPRLAPEVAWHDPVLALDGGVDGLDAYRQILPALPCLLKPGGMVLLEIGFDQAARVSALARQSEFAVEAVRPDLAGHDRMLVLRVS